MSAERPTPDPASVEAARARDRLTAVAAMAELIGHKVRNRLASFRAVLELLQAGWEQNLSAESRASALRQFEAFVRDFNFGLDMIRSDFGRPEPTSVSDLVAEALAYFRTRAPKVRLQVEIEPGLKPVSTDRRLLLLVLLNLLRNAAEAAAEVPDACLRLRAAQSSDGVRLEIEDNGPGVPADLHGRLLVESVTSREDGIGLGLILCRDAMTVLGGTVALVTPKGAPGACFRVDLPAGRANQPAPGRPDPPISA
jgi:signal transduction histidine kinase